MFSTIYAIFVVLAERREKKMESSAVFTLRLLQRLAEGCTLQELLEEAAKLGLWDVSVCDAAYNLLASSHPPRNDNVFVLQQSAVP